MFTGGFGKLTPVKWKLLWDDWFYCRNFQDLAMGDNNHQARRQYNQYNRLK